MPRHANPPSRLHVAVVHSFYGSASPSGENQAVLDQMDALQRAGHTVSLVAAHTDRLQDRPLYSVRAALTVATGRGRSPAAALRRLRPDVTHVHNLFPNFGRSWARSWTGPLVATVHNYRPLCAAATLYRDGAVCTRCPEGDRWAGGRHGCYRGSAAATVPLAVAGCRGAAADPLLHEADRVAVLSEQSRDVYLRAGLPADRLAIVANFVSRPGAQPRPAVDRSRWAYVGRLSEEKGILELLRQWPDEQPLDVVGDGELMQACRSVAPRAVRFLGTLEREEVRRRLPSWAGLLFPSRCFEGAPLVYPEALAAGLPVLAWAGSSVGRAVQEHGTGLVVRPGMPLGPAVAQARRTFPALRRHCREVYAAEFSEQRWLERTLSLYQQAARSRATRASSGGGA
ncbi:glycosyltransferase family 4 protein [Streptacidiphilus sp. EB129]|uniref:glycosyltransferase family 4 protein n=1 Tax=Streptacidiphilus sp. EB129 TaxID=3156262 RepID=UPI003512F6E0